MYLSMQPYQTLKREIVTPTLPQFITSCLNLVKSRRSSDFEDFNVSCPLLPSILDAFCILIPYHPTLFRPHLVRISSLISPLLAPTNSSVPLDDGEDTAARASSVIAPQCSIVAQRLHVLLPYCAPKSTSSEVWLKGFKTTILEVQKTSDQVFRAVIEDWEPISGHPPYRVDARTFGDTVSDDGGRAMGLPGWIGIQAGIERLVGLLRLLGKYIATPTGATVSLPLGLVMNILTRIFSITVPPSREKDSRQEGIRLNPQIGKDEREGLWVGLPQVHVAGMELLWALVERLGSSFFPMAQGSLDQIGWVFNAEQWDVYVITYASRCMHCSLVSR
jgi:pre-rRNA-processing protein RIX1